LKSGKSDMTADDFEFNPETYEEEITKLYRPWDYNEIPVCVKMRDITQPNSWFGVVDVILPGASMNYNRPIHCTLLGWCTANDLLVSLEYFDGHEWKPCGILK
jgi:hypothetical protein